MEQIKKIAVGDKTVKAYCIPLQSKNFILIKGGKGYIMCGYLNILAAEVFSDAAIMIKGVSTIDQALDATVHSLTVSAARLGIKKGQSVRTVLKLIA
ncbi:MAG: DUF1805 domain-containing protein [Candidatus Omnitrophica bacterium]|nr:DUF1805 domain-containing protein [Candidatus Omnitrophota bacterium]